MGVYKNEAWVVSAVNDVDVKKAVVLAGSLRRVMTTKKLVAVFTPNISGDSRNLLREKFDLALVIDEEIPDGLDPTDYAKMFTFSLIIFHSCVYLSTSTMVLQNCDDIFESCKSFAAFKTKGDQGWIDTSVFYCTPSARLYKAMKMIAGKEFLTNGSNETNRVRFSNNFGKWLQKQESIGPQALEERYNQRIFLLDQKEIYDGLQSDLGIVNFKDAHPIDLMDRIMNSGMKTLGMVESYVVDRWLTIYSEDVKTIKFRIVEEKAAFTKRMQEWQSSVVDNEPVAIIGMSGRFPGANTVDDFWQMLVEGREGIANLPDHRWTRDTSLMLPASRDVTGGFLTVPIDEFDAKFFGLSPKDIIYLDPQQRFLHEVTWEALEDANVDPGSLQNSHVGVYVGSWLLDYKDVTMRNPEMDFYRMYMGNSLASEAARLSYFLDTTGPSITTESGCSSAICAVDMAFKSLRNRDVSMAIACGVNLFIHPFDQSLLTMVVAPDGRCKTFDAKANGFGRAEACCSLVMKRLADAIRDGDNIWGLIKGSALTQEGISKSLGTPTVECEALAMELALKDAGVVPHEVSFVEAHGTGTIVGDPLEVTAIQKAYSTPHRKEPLIIGSVKTNVGHTESVSGITGIIKTVLAMKYQVIPQHLNFETLNPDIDLDAIPAKLPLQAESWPRTSGKPRIAGVSSFGISGSDGHVIVQEAPMKQDTIVFNQVSLMNFATRPLHIMKLSAKSRESLDDLVGRHVEYLEAGILQEDSNFADYAYTANAGRAAFDSFRAFIVAKDAQEAVEILRKDDFKKCEVKAQGGKLCFLFTGQGSQYVGMAKQLYETSPTFKMSFDKCSNILKDTYNISIKNIMWSEDTSGKDLNSTLYSQTSIFCVEYSLWKLWTSWGVTPDYVLGHSLGEFAAAVACGALSLKSALHLVAVRSRLIHHVSAGKMIVVRTDRHDTEKLLKDYLKENPGKWLDYAAVNCYDQTVLAGEPATVEDFNRFCEKANVKTVLLAATHAFHSRHMDNILKEYTAEASSVLKLANWNNSSNSQYISGLTGKLVEDMKELIDPNYWARHTRERVNFIDACRTAKNEGCTFFVEVGPHPVLAALALANVDDSNALAFPSLQRNKEDWVVLLNSLGKLFLSNGSVPINWKNFDSYYSRKKVTLPFYPFNRKKVWAEIHPVPSRIHPLLGALRENASSITMFENAIGASSKICPYLQEHIIGNTVVVPGAAFLEMLLTGGHAHVQGITDEFVMPRRPITLKGLKIESPLGLSDVKTTRLQVTVELEKDEDGTSVKGYKARLFHWEQQVEDDSAASSDGYWVSHANGYFMPMVNSSAEDICEAVNVTEIQETWEENNQSQEMYKKLPDVGLRFGESFRSILKGWRNADKTRLLLNVKVPEDANKYIAHPALVDAMFQGAVLWKGAKDPSGVSKKLHVPLTVEEFIWWRGTDSTTRYIYCSKDLRSETVQVTMLDQDGPLMTLSGVDFVETSVSVVESVIQQQGSKVPGMWEEIFRHRPGPLELQMNYGDFDGSLISDEVLVEALQNNTLEPDEEKMYKHLDGITISYYFSALYELGWSTHQIGEKYSLRDLMDQLKISEVFTNFMRFFMTCLTSDGYLECLSADNYVIKAVFPTKEQIRARIEAGTFTETEKKRGDYLTINAIGEKLPEILIGKVHPLSILFPEGGSTKLADAFYETITVAATKCGGLVFKSMLDRRFSANLEQLKKVSSKLRVLEVGAGTGMQTGRCLEQLEEYNPSYEYHFTDISAAFFASAEEKFSKYASKMKFQRLDIEQCPLSQGFSPDYYDVVIAAEVLHATRDIKEALGNIRLLMRDGACIQIFETTQKDRRLTFIFGLLEGYWRFQDYDLRPDHATLSISAWELVLSKYGFERVVSIPAYCNVHTAVLGLAKKNYYPEGMLKWFPTVPVEKKPRWVVFGNGSNLQDGLCQRLASLDRDIKVLLPEVEVIEKITSKEAVEEIFGKDETVEGIIYLWGLPPKDDNDIVLGKNQKIILEAFIFVCQLLWDNQKTAPKSFVVTRGLCKVDDTTVLDPTPSTLHGVSKVLRSETSVHNKCIDLASDIPADAMTDHVFRELWYHNDAEEIITFRGLSDEVCKRFSPRLTAVRVTNDPLPLPKGSERFQLVLPETRMIQDLEFTFLPCYTLGDTEIEIKVKATALNFRDLFAVLKPDVQFEKINAIGTDFAGVVTAVGSKVTKRTVGEAVFGCNYNDDQALPSHIKLEEERVLAVPNHFTFAEAATLPAVFATAFYCLVTVGNISAEDTVLIHTGSGGVGLSAIQIAQHYRCKNIITTAGSERKRAYLRSLGIKHVFHSRNTQYAEQILKVTEGQGVTLVLNSLTSEGFKEATLRCCSQGARFVEMSKLSIWKPEDVKALRPDVKYTVADLTNLEEETWKSLYEQMKDYVEHGRVKPMPYVRFDAVAIRAALDYMQKAKHIGKIVCIMPEVMLQNGKLKQITPLFNDRSLYIITGGITGGIGLEAAKFMLNQGAKHLILVGRKEPNEKTTGLLNAWTSEGHNVQAWQCDVGDYSQLTELFERIKDPALELPPLRGIQHAAGVLQDATLPNQTWEKFEMTFTPKVSGSWYLHELTKDLNLEHFVFYSSLAAVFGTPGQANHCSGNYYEDTLANYRQGRGLPAITINWGSWGQVGVATEIEIPGFRPLSTAQGIAALDLILRTDRVQTGVMNVESFSVFAKYCPRIKNYIDDKSLFADTKAFSLYQLNSDEFWEEVDSVEDRVDKEEVFKKYIKIMIRAILKMDPEEPIDDNVELQTLGVDSLMMLEMKNGLQNLFGSRMTVNANELKGCNTLQLLATKLVEILLTGASKDEVPPTPEEFRALIEEDTLLPKTMATNIATALPGVKCPSEIKTVLITGITGMLGPYILRRVISMSQVSRIICVVRKRGKLSSLERMQLTLAENGLLDELPDLNKVECIEGDVGQPRLGMKEEDYETFADEVDGVIHCAAKLDHTQFYRRTAPQEKFHVRTINVGGTKNVLEFCSFKKRKLLLHASTYGVIYTVNEETGSLSEEWEERPPPGNVPVQLGYIISKAISEQLIRQAVQNDWVLVKAFRFPSLCGDSRTGWHDIRGNHIMLRYLTYMKVNAMPSFPIPLIHLPVDYCADVAVKLFFDDETPYSTFNIVPRNPELEQDFLEIAKQEYDRTIEVVEYEEFVEKIKVLGEQSPIYPFMSQYENYELVKQICTSPAYPTLEEYMKNDPVKFFHSAKLAKYCSDLYDKMESPLQALRRDLKYLKDKGIFTKFGI